MGKGNFASVINTNAYGHIKELLRVGDTGLSDLWSGRTLEQYCRDEAIDYKWLTKAQIQCRRSRRSRWNGVLQV